MTRPWEALRRRRSNLASVAVSAALLAAIAVALAVGGNEAAFSGNRPIPRSATPQTLTNEQIERQHDQAQACRTWLGYKPWPTSRSWEWAIGSDYRAWVYDLWRRRALACRDVRAGFERLERSVPDAARWAAREWGVAASWLISCARSEGGLDAARIVIGTHGDTGWWQFLSGTWLWMSNAAWKATEPSPPPRYRRITSPVGQAYTAGWAFAHGYQTPGAQPIAPQWYGTGC